MTIDIKTILSELPINRMKSDKFTTFLEDMEDAYDLFITDFIFSTTNDVYEVFTGAFLKRFAQYFEPILKETNEKQMMNAFFIYKFFEELDGQSEHGYRILAPITLEELRNRDIYGDRTLPQRFKLKVKDKDNVVFTALMFILVSINKDFDIGLIDFKKANSDGNAFTQNSGTYGEAAHSTNDLNRSSRSLGFLKFYDFIMKSGWLTDIDLALIAYMKSHVLKNHIDVLYTDDSFNRNELGKRLKGLNRLLVNVKELNGGDYLPAYFSHVFPVGNYISRPNVSLIAILFSNAMNLLQPKLMDENCDTNLKKLTHSHILKVYERFNEVLANPKDYYRDISVLFNAANPIEFNTYRPLPEVKNVKYFNPSDIFYVKEVEVNTEYRDITILGVPNTVFGNLPFEYMKGQLLASINNDSVFDEFEDVFNGIMSTFDTLMDYTDKNSTALAEYSAILFDESYASVYNKSGVNEVVNLDEVAFSVMQSSYKVVPPFILKLAEHPILSYDNVLSNGRLNKSTFDNIEAKSFLPSISGGEIFDFFERIMDIERESLHAILKSGLYKNSRRTSILFSRYDTTRSSSILNSFSKAVCVYFAYQGISLDTPNTNKINFNMLEEMHRASYPHSNKVNNLVLWYILFQYAVEDDYVLYADSINSLMRQFFKIVENCEIINHITTIYAHLNSSLSLERCLDTTTNLLKPETFSALYIDMKGLANTDIGYTVSELDETISNAYHPNTKELLITEKENFLARKLDTLEGKELCIQKFLNNALSFIDHINKYGYTQVMQKEVLPILKDIFNPEVASTIITDDIKLDTVLLEPKLYTDYAKGEILRNQVAANMVKNPIAEYYEYYMNHRDFLYSTIQKCQTKVSTIAKIFDK